MGSSVPAGAAGSGFIGGTAGVLLIVVGVVAVLSVGPVREMLLAHVRQVAGYFMGPVSDPSHGTAATPVEGDGGTDAGVGSGRASDRDSYAFDLSVLALGDHTEPPAPSR